MRAELIIWLLAALALVTLGAAAWLGILLRNKSRQYEHRLAALERSLREEQARIEVMRARQQAIGLAVPHVLLALDSDRRITWANLAARVAFGEIDGKTLIEATRSHELDALLDDARASDLVPGRPDDVLVRTITLGQQILSVRLARLSGGSLLMLQDQSELQRLGRARRDFVANISHELRTPLAAIRLLVDTLQAGALGDTAVATEMLSKIGVEVDALSQQAHELLDLSLIESGQMPIRLEPMDLNGLIEAQVERFLPQAQQKELALTVDIPPDTRVLADGVMVGRVLSNLMHNAWKFTPAGGQICLEARVEGENVVVSVGDTGPGIAREELGRIFERFYKVDRARGQSGTGLGLAIARHIVEGHGGRIWAESDPGHGAVFYFTLPAAS